MLADAHSVSERGRIQGFNDFAVFGLVTVASLASGGLLNCFWCGCDGGVGFGQLCHGAVFGIGGCCAIVAVLYAETIA